MKSDTITLIMDRKDANGLYDYLKMEVSCQIGWGDYEPSKDIEYQHSFLRAVFDAKSKELKEEIEEENYRRFCDGVREEE